MVLLPKMDGSMSGIGLLYIFWKLIGNIIYQLIKCNLVFHDIIHGFRTSCGTGTEILDVKFIQKLSCKESIPLYMVFLYLRKSYENIDRGNTLKILSQYGLGYKTIKIIYSFWNKKYITCKKKDIM